MLTDLVLPNRLQGFLELGDFDSLRDFQETWRDYVGEFQLTAADTPALLGILELWFQWHREDDYPDEPQLFAPIHAWRALGQLKAVEAVEPMLANLDLLDEVSDDWSLEDWPRVFGMFGPPVIESLSEHLRNPSHREFSRDSAVGGLLEIAQRHPERRDQVVRILTDQLALHEPWPTLNGLILCRLLDLEAVESAEVIERAFAAEVIDEESCGDWRDVREKLGVEGLGIAPLWPRNPRWNPGVIGQLNQYFLHSAEQEARQKRKFKQEKAKRKAAAKSRKRNRRAKS